jgi:SAM-dependent methyltransferase
MNSSYFNSRYTPDPDRHRVWRAVCEYLQEFIPPDGAVLDVGAGYCDFINQVAAGQKYAADLNPDVARFCARDVHFLQGAAGAPFNLADGSIDVVMASNLVEHLSEPQCTALFDECDRVLRKPGRVILIQPNYYYCYREYWDDFTHVRAFSHVSGCDFLLSRGYTILRAEKRFMPFSFKSWAPKSYWLTRLYLASFWRPMAKQMLIVAQR